MPGKAITLAGANPKDTNTIVEPTKIIPSTTKATGLGKSFSYTFPAYSITVLEVKAQ